MRLIGCAAGAGKESRRRTQNRSFQALQVPEQWRSLVFLELRLEQRLESWLQCFDELIPLPPKFFK